MGKRKNKARAAQKAEADSSTARPKPPTHRAPLLERVRIFLTTPSWLGFATWLGVISAIAFSAITYLHDREKENDAAEQALSRIDYAWTIKPAPEPREEFESTGRWEVALAVANGGPTTADTVVLHLRTPSPSVFLHSAPTVMSDAAAAGVEIRDRVPDGIYEIVYKNLTPGDSAWVHMFYRVPEDRKDSFMRTWRTGGMFKQEFAKEFVYEFFFSGAHIKVSNIGALDFQPSL
jgi:hypothetical protein